MILALSLICDARFWSLPSPTLFVTTKPEKHHEIYAMADYVSATLDKKTSQKLSSANVADIVMTRI